MNKTPILITGCQRSGTTLLSLVLDSHSDILSIDEEDFRYADLPTYIHAPWYPDYVAFKLPQYAQLVQFIKDLPRIRVLWCVRDPMDVVASMLSLKLPINAGVEEVNWALHPGCGRREILNTFWSFDADLRTKYAEHMQKYQHICFKQPAEISREETVYAASLCWTIKNDIPVNYDEKGIDYRAVKYEQLVTDPHNEISAVLDYIGADWDDNVLMHHKLHSGVSIGNTENTRQIDKSSIGRGRQRLNAGECEQVADTCRLVAEKWGYDI